jgi:hypothetical protein
VTSRGAQVQVKVPDQAPLSNVLSAVCSQQKIKCTGTETLTSYRGPAMTVEGSLRQVISKLLEGTDVNYEFSRTAEGGATAIAFLGHAPRGTAPVPTPSGPQKPDHPTILHSHPYPGTPPSNTPPSTTPSNPPQSKMQIGPIPGQGSTPVATESQSAVQNANAAAHPLTGNDTAAAKYLPFPDQNGQLIPVNHTPETVQPFPDQYGNPIPLKRSQSGSPFPSN